MTQTNFTIRYSLSSSLIILLWLAPTILCAQIPYSSAPLNLPPSPSLEDSLGQINYRATLSTIDGDTLTFDSLKGKVIFAHIWATTCGPCIPELPALQQLHELLPGKFVAFLMISQDDSTELVQEFLESRDLDFPVQFMRSGWAFAHVPPGTPIQVVMPSTYIIDQKGIIRYKHIGAAKWDSPDILKFITSLTNGK